jgi:hypothetical protein
MKIRSKLLSIAVTLTVISTALVIAAPKHIPPPHVHNSGGHGKNSPGTKGGKKKKLARAGRSRSGNGGFGDQLGASLTPTPTPTPEVSPSPSGNPAT